MAQAELAFCKSSFAVSQVVAPHPLETLVVSQLGNLIDLVVKALPPMRQGARVMLGIVFQLDQAHVGGFGYGLHHGADTGDKAAGENVFLNEIHAF